MSTIKALIISIRCMYHAARSMRYIYRRLVKQKILDKKSAETLVINAIDETYSKDVEIYEDTHEFGYLSIVVEMLYWIRYESNSSPIINQFCTQQMNQIEFLVNEGALEYKISAADKSLIDYTTQKYHYFDKNTQNFSIV